MISALQADFHIQMHQFHIGLNLKTFKMSTNPIKLMRIFLLSFGLANLFTVKKELTNLQYQQYCKKTIATF